MIGRIIGTIAGNQAAKLRYAAPTVLRRWGSLGLIAAAGGGYACNSYLTACRSPLRRVGENVPGRASTLASRSKFQSCP